VLLGWPESLLTTDILFLLPSIWTGPVVAPVINSLCMLLLAVVILNNRKGLRPVIKLSKMVWILLILGTLIILFAYMKDFAAYVSENSQSLPSDGNRGDQLLLTLSTQFIPRTFDWWLFCIGVCMHFAAVFLIMIGKRRNSENG
jgi:hypothetical protein